jgi:hypothetical protein
LLIAHARTQLRAVSTEYTAAMMAAAGIDVLKRTPSARQQQQQQQHVVGGGGGDSQHARMGGPLFGRSLRVGCEWGGVRHATPVVIQRAVHFLNTSATALTTEGIFRLPGNASVLDRMRRQFDAGVDVDVAAESGGDAHVVASLLVQVA